jgi:hypothetical protein
MQEIGGDVTGPGVPGYRRLARPGINPIVAVEKQRLRMIADLV